MKTTNTAPALVPVSLPLSPDSVNRAEKRLLSALESADAAPSSSFGYVCAVPAFAASLSNSQGNAEKGNKPVFFGCGGRGSFLAESADEVRDVAEALRVFGFVVKFALFVNEKRGFEAVEIERAEEIAA